MSVRLIKPGTRQQQIRRLGDWMDVARPNRTLADDVTMALDGLTRGDDVRLLQACTLLGQRCGRKLAQSW